jgi:hypothetical protein
MRYYEEVQVPAKKQKVLTKTTCDLCGAEAKKGLWDSSIYEVNETVVEVTVRQKEGETYPEEGWGTDYKVDICPKCFKDKLIPWLESQGCKAERKEWEY